MKRIIMFSVLLASAFPAFSQAKQFSPGLYLLPTKGGVGVQRELQMEIVQKPGSGAQMSSIDMNYFPTHEVTWESSDGTIAVVDQTGLVTGKKKGEVTITAVVNWLKHGSPDILRSHISVETAVAGLKIVDSGPVLQYCRRNVEVQPIGRNGQPLNNRPVTWRGDSYHIVTVVPASVAVELGGLTTSSRDPQVAANELFFHRTARVMGQRGDIEGSVTASCEGVSRIIPIRVNKCSIGSMQFTTHRLEVDVGECESAHVTALNEEGCEIPSDDIEVAWEAADPQVATAHPFPPAGCMICGRAAGTTKLLARAQSGAEAVMEVTVPGVAFVTVVPLIIFPLQVGQKETITAYTRSSTGRKLQNRKIDWKASDDCVSLRDPSGITGEGNEITGLHSGAASVIATSEGKWGPMPAIVPSVREVDIKPSYIGALQPHERMYFTAKVIGDPFDTLLVNRIVTWHLSDDCVSLINREGYKVTVQAQHSGYARITAKCEGVSSSSYEITVVLVEQHEAEEEPENEPQEPQCEAASILVYARQSCGWRDTVGYCHEVPITTSLITVDGKYIGAISGAEPCDSGSDQPIHYPKSGDLECSDCYAHVDFWFVNMKPGLWEITVSFSSEISTCTVSLDSGDQKVLRFTRGEPFGKSDGTWP